MTPYDAVWASLKRCFGGCRPGIPDRVLQDLWDAGFRVVPREEQ